MKSFFKKLLARAVRHPACWRALEISLFKLTRFLERERFHNDQAPPPPRVDLSAAAKIISSDLTVRHGPFRGLQYPDGKSVGSVLVPKLLGSYERELHPLLARLTARNYSEIVDIGCAEGFYAVGLARMFPAAKIFAYDTNPEARRLCRQMAETNGVTQRLTTGAICDAATLQQLPLTRRALVVSDCEGYEKQLFTPEMARCLAAHDVLIEVHDMVDIEISDRLRAAFQATHSIEVISSVDDIRKARQYAYPELQSFTLAERYVLLREWRETSMDWFYFTPRA